MGALHLRKLYQVLQPVRSFRRALMARDTPDVRRAQDERIIFELLLAAPIHSSPSAGQQQPPNLHGERPAREHNTESVVLSAEQPAKPLVRSDYGQHNQASRSGSTSDCNLNTSQSAEKLAQARAAQAQRASRPVAGAPRAVRHHPQAGSPHHRKLAACAVRAAGCSRCRGVELPTGLRVSSFPRSAPIR
eukprot:scaffold3159_cov393-Prasinococcus_capsulatus_cf.AAC.23